MIVRIFSEGQYRIEDGLSEKMNELDHACADAVQADDADRFHASYDELLGLIRAEGEKLGDEELTGSDLMLPPSDIAMDEAREAFSGDGLLPG